MATGGGGVASSASGLHITPTLGDGTGTSFPVTAVQLKQLVEAGLDSKKKEEVVSNVETKLREIGGLAQIQKVLQTSVDTGVSSTSVEGRRGVFGENRLPREEPESLLQLMIDALKDPTLILLMISASISIIFGMIFECITTGWIEGVAIFVAVAVVDLVASINDWQKDKQFQKLNAIKDDIQVAVIRDGKQTLVSVFDVVVGDIVEMSVGDILCADGIFLSGNDLKVNEASLTGESDDMRKGHYAFAADGKISSNPFVFGGTKVMEGNGRMVVVGVGANSYAGSSAQLMSEEEVEDSVLQKQLNTMTKHITVAGTAAALIVVGVLLLRIVIDFGTKKEGYESFNKNTHPREILRFFITAITVLVVAIPEGLPLAVTIALAFSVKKMLKDQNLVRHLSACETMGGATTICSDKTGTLTMNRMTVMNAWNFAGSGTGASPTPGAPGVGWGLLSDQTGNNVKAEVRSLVLDSIALNSSARLEFPVSGPPEHIGNKTECALLQFLNTMGLNYEEARAAGAAVTPKIYNFSSARKRMSTLWPPIPGRTTEQRLYCKGAPEIILHRCSHIMDLDTMKPVALSPEMRERIINGIINSFAEQCLRTLCIAYRSIPPGASINLDDPDNSVEVAMTCLILVGIEDPVRPEVPEAIRKCRVAGITVRMVTGDNIVTARSISKKCGIADQIPGYLAMEGPEFRARVQDKSTGALNQAEIDKIWPTLLVLARSSPKDKHMLVSGIMASSATTRQIVAVTGDGTNDGPALKKAHVGFAMGITGTSVAKDAADIIIMDDNFSSIVNAVKWGRCVYDNICKFLSFQLTVNIVAITIAVVGACAIEVSPLKAIHLLWINLIMDSLASLALATEGPTDDLLERKPYGRDRPLLSPIMLRNMLCNAAYQLGVMFWAIWGMYKHLDIPSGIPDGPEEGGCEHTNITVHFTMVFNIFVFMQLFSEINSRRINNEINTFDKFFDNPFFLAVLLITAGLQVLLIEVGDVAFETTHLNWWQWLISIVFGFAELFLYPLVFRNVPSKWFEPLSHLLSTAPKASELDEGEDEPPGEPKLPHTGSARSLPRAASAYKMEPPSGFEMTSVSSASTNGAGVASPAVAAAAAGGALAASAFHDSFGGLSGAVPSEPLASGQLTPTPPDDLEPVDGPVLATSPGGVGNGGRSSVVVGAGSSSYIPGYSSHNSPPSAPVVQQIFPQGQQTQFQPLSAAAMPAASSQPPYATDAQNTWNSNGSYNPTQSFQATYAAVPPAYHPQ